MRTLLALLAAAATEVAAQATNKCAIHNTDCQTCYGLGGSGCTWCPSNKDIAGRSACIPTSTRDQCPFLLPKSRCGSQCTLKTCPEDATCSDSADMKPICRCNKGFRSIDPDKSDKDGGVMCAPVADNGQVGQKCRDFGNPDDLLFGKRGFNARKSCRELTKSGTLCVSSMSGFRNQARTQCPVTCSSMCARDHKYGPCGCKSSANLKCDNFYVINANCPIHELGRIVPARCDNPNTAVDDKCAQVYTQWYRRCYNQLKTDGANPSMQRVIQKFSSQLTEFNEMCLKLPPKLKLASAYTLYSPDYSYSSYYFDQTTGSSEMSCFGRPVYSSSTHSYRRYMFMRIEGGGASWYFCVYKVLDDICL